MKLRVNILGTALLTLLLSSHCFAKGQYCEQANADGNREYPTMDSKCTVVDSDGTGTTISARFLGPQLPTHDTDPVCRFPATTVKCRRICGDLPSGTIPGEVVATNIEPPNYARFDKFEDFDKGTHHTVCYRVKNWANNGGLNGGEYRTFFYKVSYQSAKTTSSPSPSKVKGR